jgi:hypothetical protein
MGLFSIFLLIWFDMHAKFVELNETFLKIEGIWLLEIYGETLEYTVIQSKDKWSL